VSTANNCPPSVTLLHCSRLHLPSSCLSFSPAGIDHLFARSAPAKAFDQLDPDAFDVPLFFAALIIGAAAMLALKTAVSRKKLASAWK
jgi:hypothetical protein